MIIYFSECVFGRDHVIMKKIADVLQAWLHSVSDFEFVFLEIELFDELLPIYEGFGFESTVVEEKIDLF